MIRIAAVSQGQRAPIHHQRSSPQFFKKPAAFLKQSVLSSSGALHLGDILGEYQPGYSLPMSKMSFTRVSKLSPLFH